MSDTPNALPLDVEGLREALKNVQFYGGSESLRVTRAEWDIIRAAAESTLPTPPAAPKDHVLLKREITTGEVAVCRFLGAHLLTAEKAASYAERWNAEWPGAIYTAVKLG